MPKNSKRSNSIKIESEPPKPVEDRPKTTEGRINGSKKVERERAKSNNWNTLPRPKPRYAHTHQSEYIEPNNKSYLSHYLIQKVWKPSKPIGPIGATFSSPGPAIVNLPPTFGEENHDKRKYKNPSYKIGERENPLYHYIGPGPAAYDTTKLTNQGIDECHAPKCGIKVTELPGFMSPGPAAYARGDSDQLAYPHAPAYTMRKRMLKKDQLIGPGPNAYTLPDCMHKGLTVYGGGPSYSVRIKDSIENPLVGPGPAGYDSTTTDTYKEKPPSYTMGHRYMSRRQGPDSPGPASNEMHLVKYHKYSTPRFTFGIKHSPYKAFQRFAPGD